MLTTQRVSREWIRGTYRCAFQETISAIKKLKIVGSSLHESRIASRNARAEVILRLKPLVFSSRFVTSPLPGVLARGRPGILSGALGTFGRKFVDGTIEVRTQARKRNSGEERLWWFSGCSCLSNMCGQQNIKAKGQWEWQLTWIARRTVFFVSNLDLNRIASTKSKEILSLASSLREFSYTYT